ncbi:TlpA family protein disulfide reductase [Heyndrickxia sp. NPDC080065]|uniref:TlpA family protein disulfide reductase n=1 Tax=Heyndrickxia sp. NPDC080065 TaxID=3390568 RepID=UPI003CFDA88E
MLKKILPIVIISILVGVMVVQAVGKEKDYVSADRTKKTIINNNELEQMYYDSLSSQVEEPVSETEDLHKGLETGSSAPDFQLKTLDGKVIRLSDMKGKKVIINFFATWCQPCRSEMPLLENFYQKHRTDIEILAINIDTKANVKGFINKLGLTFPILLDIKDIINNRYQIIAIPTTYFIDQQGKIIAKHIGQIDSKILEKILKKSP